MNIRCLISVLILTVAFRVGAQNLDLPYSSGSTGADGPFVVPSFAQATVKSSMTYDPLRGECLLFGGSVGATYLNTTWTWNGSQWLVKTPTVSPGARNGAAMAFDAVRGEVVMFGGRSSDANGARLNDTWVWNGVNWTLRSPTISPSQREGAAMAWDAERGEIILVGGESGTASTGTLSSETWAWNGSNWALRSPQGGGAPAGSFLAMTYDAQTRQVLVLGDANTSFSGIWAWDGSAWINRVGTGFLPPIRRGSVFVFNPSDQLCYLFGGIKWASPSPELGDTWTWNGSTGVWTELSYPQAAPARGFGVGAFDAARGEFMISHGSNNQAGSGGMDTDTWVLKDGEWLARAGSVYTFDLRSKAEAIWNFTTINIRSGATVYFRKSAANNGVLWLASEGVTIDGTLDVSGRNGFAGSSATGGGGGAGAYDGGRSSQPGSGPGGGIVGTAPTSNALHADASGNGPYGTLFAQPALGGSGGGGFGSGSGGGGGGALVISCSRDLTLNGSLLARGGTGGGSGSTFGGTGSGGLIRLVADRITLGSGALIDPGDTLTTGKGRARLEAYIRQIPNSSSQIKGSKSLSVPVVGSILAQAGGRLSFVKVAGATVVNPPKGDVINPDVIFTASGAVDIEVHALNVPDGTPVTVTINHSIAGVINLSAVTLQQCKATFTATIPAGQGVMQAFATYNVGGPTGNGAP